MKMNRTMLLRGLALLALAGGALAVNPDSVQAWGGWSAWAPRGTTATCSDGSATNGSAWVPSTAAQTLWASAPQGTWARTQAQGKPMYNGAYTTVTATSDQSASATAPANLSHARCRYEVIIAPI